jgi:hypothetical protein
VQVLTAALNVRPPLARRAGWLVFPYIGNEISYKPISEAEWEQLWPTYLFIQPKITCGTMTSAAKACELFRWDTPSLLL